MRRMNEVEGLVGIEKEVYLYAYAVKPNGNLMDNSEIARELGITEEYLLDVLDSINNKITSSRRNWVRQRNKSIFVKCTFNVDKQLYKISFITKIKI